ncbi:hypothetical protein RHGRI_016769 [Rhododendron griersonianum]|uniref:Uncharacterized protein n=1 Tax=Rhododendron griersonianum TaxID=479676 RepID=A0AAV6JVS7_9ERIC|nr:hypothetical protein RHGRI_016769 [Rhododendron griersonianum]
MELYEVPITWEVPPPATNPEYFPLTKVPVPPVENFEQPFSFPTFGIETDPELEDAMLDLSQFWNRSSALLRDSYDFKCLNFDDIGNGNCCTLPVCENVYADCCDGSDEYDGKVKCSNTCWEAGKVARDKLKKKIATYQEGVTLRKHEIEQAKLALAKDEAELSKLKNEEKILKGLVQQFKGK